MSDALVSVIMGSKSDLSIMQEAAQQLEQFGIPFEINIVSAHRTPERLVEYATGAHKRGIQVIIAGAGGAAHLPGMVAAMSPLPVIGVPINASNSLDGWDSVLSILQMPSGVPVATVALNGARNAAILAAQILGLTDPVYFQKVINFKQDLKKTVIEAAYPGDIVGLYDTGNFKIGDTLTQGEKMNFKGIPSFSPELFRYVLNADPMKSKQLAKGLEQLTDEGVAQLFTKLSNGSKILGTVGALQFEVIQYRLNSEYSASCNFESMNLHKACWVACADRRKLQAFVDDKFQHIAKDKEGNYVFLAESAWALQMAQEKNPDIEFHFTSEY